MVGEGLAVVSGVAFSVMDSIGMALSLSLPLSLSLSLRLAVLELVLGLVVEDVTRELCFWNSFGVFLGKLGLSF